jgi:hypothetical protein
MLVNTLASTILGGITAASALALPKNTFNIGSLTSRAASGQAIDQLLLIAPESKSCAQPAGSCRTAEQAAPFLIQAFKDYGIYNANEIAVVLSLIAFETEGFFYDSPASPTSDTAGKGTRNMQSFDYNLLYAKSIPALASKVEAMPAETAEQKIAILNLVLPDEYSWASAMWFLTKTKCAVHRPALQAGSPSAFADYGACVGYPPAPKRDARYAAAKTALGLSA